MAKRLTISLTGSTSSIGTGGRTPSRSWNSPRSVPACAGELVDRGGVLAEDVLALGPRRVLQLEDGLGVEQVRLALAAPLVLAADLQAAVGELGGVVRVGAGVTSGDLGGEHVEPDALEPARRCR